MTDFNELIKRSIATIGGETQEKQKEQMKGVAPAAPSYAEGFVDSAISSTKELFGFNATPEALEFRRDNPVGGFVSDFAGTAVPYVGWYKGTKKLKQVDKIINSIGDEKAKPFLTGAMREAVRFAPFEAARIGVGVTLGDKDFSDMLGSAAANLALEAGVGGVIGSIVGAGKKAAKLSDLVPGASDYLPPQLQLREVTKAINAGVLDPEATQAAQQMRNKLALAVRQETVGSSGKYVNELEFATPETARQLNRLFKPAKEQASILRKRLIQSTKDFESTEAWGKLTKDFNLPDGFESYTQFPRVLEFTKNKPAKTVDSLLTKNLTQVENGWFMGKEANDGMYVMAKKLGQVGKGGKTDKWLMFKTDTPGAFAPKPARWTDAVVRRNAWLAENDGFARGKDLTGYSTLDLAHKLRQEIPFEHLQTLTQTAEGKQNLKKGFLAKLGVKNPLKGNAFIDGLQQQFLDDFVPSMFQFNNNARAAYVFKLSKLLFDDGDSLAQGLMYGKLKLREGKNLFTHAVKGADKTTEFMGKASIKSLLDELSESDLAQVWKAWNNQIPLKQLNDLAAAGKFSPNALKLLARLDEVDDFMVSQIQGTQAAFGQKLFTPRKNHYGISRTWVGDYRTPVYNEAGELVYMASGKSAKAAQDEADAIISGVKSEGKSWKAGEAFLQDRGGDLSLGNAGWLTQLRYQSPDYLTAAELREKHLTKVNTPKTFERRSDVGGFLGEKAPWTKQELEKLLGSHLTTQAKYVSELTSKYVFEDQLLKLMDEDPRTFTRLNQRLQDLAGKPGPLAQATNQLTDKVLAPVLGKNSATKIARTANSLMMHFNLGALNMAFPVLNATTFLQTVMPHAAYVMSATPERISKYYSWYPIAGSDGKPRGGVGALDMFKLMRQSFKEMGKPDGNLREMIERAAVDRVWDPRLVEEYVGENAAVLRDWKTALSGPEGFSNWLVKLSEAAPAASEKFARLQAFTTGHIIARDFLQLQGDQAYLFAKDFTTNTMYGYSTADRARMFTGPLGSMFGMFKNWQTHYFGSMLEYMGEASRGNWNPLLWQTAGTTAVGGVGALPLYSLADKFSTMATDQGLMENIYANFGSDSNFFSDALFMGLPATLGVSLQASSEAPLANPARDASMLMSFVHLDRMNALGKAVGSAVDSWSTTGQHPITNDQVRDQFIKALAPKTVYRTMAAWEDKVLRSMSSGYTTFNDLSPYERVMYMSGFNPTYVEKSYKVADRLWRNQEEMKKKLSNYGKAWFEAKQESNFGMMEDVMKRAIAEGIDVSSIIRSANAIEAKARTPMLERQYSAAELWKYRDLLNR